MSEAQTDLSERPVAYDVECSALAASVDKLLLAIIDADDTPEGVRVDVGFAHAALRNLSARLGANELAHDRSMAEGGWQTVDNAPDGGRVWVCGGRFETPRIVEADGKWWRYDRGAGRSAPTHWAPCEPPAFNEPVAAQEQHQ